MVDADLIVQSRFDRLAVKLSLSKKHWQVSSTSASMTDTGMFLMH
jgi:hypothetical protein